MSLKHRVNSQFPDIRNVEPISQRVFWELFRWLTDTFKNIFDDLSNNDLFSLDFNDNQVNFLMGMRIKRTAVASSPYTVLMSDCYLGVDTTSARTLNLPAAATAKAGKIYIIKDESGSAGANNITIDGNSSETIDGSVTLAISSNRGVSRIVCDGSDWHTF